MSPIFKVQDPNHSRHAAQIHILGYLTGGILHEGHNHKKSWKCIKPHLVASSRARRRCSTLCCRASIPQTYQKLQPIGASCVTPRWRDVCESNPGFNCKHGEGADGLHLLSLSKAANDYRWMHCCIILAGLFSQFFHEAAKPSLHALLDPETSLLNGSLLLRSVVLRLVKSV